MAIEEAPLRSDRVLNDDGTITQRFAEFLESLRTTNDIDEIIAEALIIFQSVFAQNAALIDRIDELERNQPLELLGQIAAVDERVGDLELMQ